MPAAVEISHVGQFPFGSDAPTHGTELRNVAVLVISDRILGVGTFAAEHDVADAASCEIIRAVDGPVGLRSGTERAVPLRFVRVHPCSQRIGGIRQILEQNIGYAVPVEVAPCCRRFFHRQGQLDTVLAQCIRGIAEPLRFIERNGAEFTTRIVFHRESLVEGSGSGGENIGSGRLVSFDGDGVIRLRTVGNIVPARDERRPVRRMVLPRRSLSSSATIRR